MGVVGAMDLAACIPRGPQWFVAAATNRFDPPYFARAFFRARPAAFRVGLAALDPPYDQEPKIVSFGAMSASCSSM